MPTTKGRGNSPHVENPITISFIGTYELKVMLEEWADKEERSVSYIIRRAINREAERRKQNSSLKE